MRTRQGQQQHRRCRRCCAQPAGRGVASVVYLAGEVLLVFIGHGDVHLVALELLDDELGLRRRHQPYHGVRSIGWQYCVIGWFWACGSLGKRIAPELCEDTHRRVGGVSNTTRVRARGALARERRP